MDLISTLNSLTPSFYQLASSEGNSADVEAIYDFPPSEEPVYILGRKYSSLHELEEIRADVYSLIWVTYRRGFPSIGDSGLTADSGWGCMLRTGQMVLAQALCKLHLGRDWRWRDYEKYLKYRRILKLFADQKTAPYSIHQIALMGACEGKEVGEWFGPNTVAQVLKKLSVYDKVNDIHVHVAMDNMVFIDDIKRFCKSKIRLESMRLATSTLAVEATELNESADYWRPLVLFIPLRLGLTDINPLYFRSLKSTFALPQSLGILGGRPNHALYLIGCVGDDLVYLDPHTTQAAVNIAEEAVGKMKTVHRPEHNFEEASEDGGSSTAEEALTEVCDDVSYHCERASRLPIASLDPSLALCFLCTTEEDFDQWATLVMKKLVGGGQQHSGHSSPEKESQTQPLFEIMKERPPNWPGFEEDFELGASTSTSTSTTYTSSSAATSCSKASCHNQSQHSQSATGQCSTSAAAAAAVVDGSVPSPASSFTALESDEDYEIID
ncbi:PREDICTED: cysteine protease ATG4A-like [Rhagoletis zephyria]|uniref:cysteine protease ATG4A-like n=1 Tax=Rhagoletis zephyria TaxID=28612 RepID=UPI0008115B49|nr:PREDICTED: cysteine protease ATG4A-like [Rhagoletis zephyria]